MFDMTPFKKDSFNRKDDFLTPLLNNLFDNDFFNAMSNRGNFRADLKETNDSYLVVADLPGVKKGDIDIEFQNDNLVITAKREEAVEDNKESYVRRERHYGEFRRSFYIENVDEDKIKAKFEEGVLRIHLPKLTKDDENKRKINIQ